MNSVLIFSGRSAFDNENFRWQLLRVPEVSKIIKEAQYYIDELVEKPKDIATLIMSDNNSYLSAHLWRDFTSQLIQIGLYQRHMRQSPPPRFLIGDMGELSPMRAVLAQHNAFDITTTFVEKLLARSKEEQQNNFLVGHRLENIKAYETVNGELNVLSENKDVMELLEEITHNYIVDQVISIGGICQSKHNPRPTEVSVMESVSMDPMLSWLWPFLAAV